MEKINQNKKTSIIFRVGVLTFICMIVMAMPMKVNAAETIQETSLDEIFEIYENADLEDGMVLAPNPFADKENGSNLQEIYNKDLNDGELLVPASNVESNNNITIIAAISIAVTAIVVTMAFVLRKKLNK